MGYKEIATEVVEHLGGKDNINSVAHCATRLRVMVKDEAKINKSAVENIDQVKGAFFNSGQYQIIFGTGTVNKVYDEVAKLDVNAVTKSEAATTTPPQGSWIKRMSRTFGDVFVPIIPVLVATGLFMGVRGALTQPQVLSFFGITAVNPDFLLWTQILTDTAFAFLPVLIAWSSFKVFGGNPVIGIVLGLMLVSPNLPNAYEVAVGKAKALTFFGFIPVVGYQGSVLPAFFVGLIGSKLEKWVRKHVPDALDLLVTPFVTFVVMSVLGLFVLGPIFHVVEEYVMKVTNVALALPFGLSGLIIGGVQQIIVVTGVHHIFNFLEQQLVSETGRNPLNAYFTAAMAGQAGAVFAVGFKTKNEKLRTLAYSAGLSCMLGITEPAIFGVTLRFGKPFMMGLIAGAAGGFLGNLLNLAATGQAVTLIPGTLLYLHQLLPYLFMMVVTLAIGFALTYTVGYDDKMLEKK